MVLNGRRSMGRTTAAKEASPGGESESEADVTPSEGAGAAPCPVDDPTAAACDSSWYVAAVGDMVYEAQVL